jgi:2-dehydro-3-deoxyphosphogluconate aldolase / (4S)-4-hydroxy-2-oxoglutarate aldolase
VNAAPPDVFDVFDVIAASRILPVVTIDDASAAAELVAALVDGGLAAVEITLRTPAALDAVRQASSAVPDALVGVGSVTSIDALHDAVDAGARFAVSPGLDVRLIDAARARGIPYLPGIATATELMQAVDRDVAVVKLFPAEHVGGRAVIEAFAAVWPGVRFVPTGGVSATNLQHYLASPHVLAVGGSWMVPRTAVVSREWASITAAASAAAQLARESA